LAQQFARFSARHGAPAAARAASVNPGRLLGLDQARGLQVGQPAEFVEFDPAGAVRTVFADGQRLRG
ncbi:N-acetylglucosamine-6-phosphate deacetylase, partial [Corynebacterium sp. 11254D000AR]